MPKVNGTAGALDFQFGVSSARTVPQIIVVETTGVYDSATGYPWRELRLTASGTFTAPGLPLVGNMAFDVGGSTTIPVGTRAAMTPDRDQIGYDLWFTMSVSPGGSGSGSGSGTGSGGSGTGTGIGCSTAIVPASVSCDYGVQTLLLKQMAIGLDGNEIVLTECGVTSVPLGPCSSTSTGGVTLPVVTEVCPLLATCLSINEDAEIPADDLLWLVFVDATAGDVTVTLPPWFEAACYRIVRVDDSENTVTIVAGGTNTLNGGSPVELTAQWSAYDIEAGCTDGAWYALAMGVSGGGGTVTDFTAGDLSPLFTSSVSTSTSTPALTFTLTDQVANTVLAGPTTGADAAPTFRVLVAADIPSLSGVYQPLNANLTSISALTTTSYGLDFLELADGVAARTYIGAGTGSGTVTSVAMTMPSGFSVAGSPVTTSGTLAVTITSEVTFNNLAKIGGDDGSGRGRLALWDSANSVYRYLDGMDGGLKSSGDLSAPYVYGGSNGQSALDTDSGSTGNGRLRLRYLVGSLNYTLTATATGMACSGTLAASNLSGTNTGDQTSVSGNAGTATALQTPRTIGGVSFDGSANIVPQTIESANEASDTSCFPLFITASGTQTLQPKNNTSLTFNSSTGALGATSFVGALSGNATTATTLATARTINGVNFDGSAAITVPTLVSSVNAGILRGYIDGLITSRASTTTVTVAAGTVRDSTDAHCIYLSAATTKTLQSSGAWAAGTGNNGLDTGARANSTWYHVWAISQASGASPDVLFSTSATAPTMPSGYTLKRRIGSIKTDGSGNIILYWQYGDEFLWDVPVNDINVTNPGTAAVTRTLTLPTGVVVKAKVSVLGYGSAATDPPAGVYLSDLAATNSAPAAGLFTPVYAYGSTGLQTGTTGEVWTNTSAQIRSRCQVSTAATGVYINTIGWIDPRGRNG